jgi:hypothetical protein
MQQPVIGDVNMLPDALAIVVNADMEGIYRPYDTAQGRLKYFDV